VATRGGGQTEIVTDGVTGRLVPPGDVRALVTVLAELAADPAAARRLGAAARADVRQRFAVAPMIDAVERCYERVTA
jgi:glycosyltransferase involved in cell wall biosynthesis